MEERDFVVKYDQNLMMMMMQINRLPMRIDELMGSYTKM